MFNWMFSNSSAAAMDISPEERFEIVMSRLDEIERSIKCLRLAVLGEADDVSVEEAGSMSGGDTSTDDDVEEALLDDHTAEAEALKARLASHEAAGCSGCSTPSSV